MGMFDKLMFWKKSDDLGLADLDKSLNIPSGLSEPNLDLGMPRQQQAPIQHSFNPSPFDANQSPSQALSDQQNYTLQKEIEIVSIKLDAIKAAIENISQRLASLERFAYGNSNEQGYPREKRYYQDMPPRSY